MITCPKCGFEQPEDVFCASCGVNIKAHQQRYGKRTQFRVGIRFLSLAMILIGTAVVIFFIVKSYETKQESDNVASENVPPEAASTATPAAVLSPSPTVKIRSQFGDQNRAMLTASGIYQTRSANPTDAESVTEASPEPNPNRMQNQITVQFATATKDVLEKLGLQMGNMGSVVISNRLASGIQSLSMETHTLDEQFNAHFLHLTQEPKTKENIGFQIDVSLISKPEATDQKNLKIHIKRNLLETAAGGSIQVISQDFSESFVLQNQQMVALGGLLPRKAITDVAEAAIYDSNTLLRTLVDPQFLKFEKEFLILIKL